MTGIQALERKAPDQPMKAGQPVRREFEYIRHGTQALLAAWTWPAAKSAGRWGDTRTEPDFVALVDSLVCAHPEATNSTA